MYHKSGHTKSSILIRQIFFTSSMPIFSSVSLLLFNRDSRPESIDWTLFFLAQITNGKRNFSLYLKMEMND